MVDPNKFEDFYFSHENEDYREVWTNLIKQHDKIIAKTKEKKIQKNKYIKLFKKYNNLKHKINRKLLRLSYIKSFYDSFYFDIYVNHLFYLKKKYRKYKNFTTNVGFDFKSFFLYKQYS